MEDRQNLTDVVDRLHPDVVVVTGPGRAQSHGVVDMAGAGGREVTPGADQTAGAGVQAAVAAAAGTTRRNTAVLGPSPVPEAGPGQTRRAKNTRERMGIELQGVWTMSCNCRMLS
ncbi:hypothetical protein ACOMHN_005306 [Nucella lapillus]